MRKFLAEDHVVSLSRDRTVRRALSDLAAVTVFAMLTALAARVQFHLPFTPVPVTGQVFVVLLAGAVLGPQLGFISQVEYLAAGAAGLPVFAHGGGPAALLGPTGGYLLAFPLAAALVGALAQSNRSRLRLTLACLAGVPVIYVFGFSWFTVWTAALGEPVRVAAALSQAVAPFIFLDIAKALLAGGVAMGVRRGR
jgi:biotin transport system substrate-specific component